MCDLCNKAKAGQTLEVSGLVVAGGAAVLQVACSMPTVLATGLLAKAIDAIEAAEAGGPVPGEISLPTVDSFIASLMKNPRP